MSLQRIKRFPPRPADFRCKAAPQYPYNQLPASSGLSEPVYDIKVERNILVTASDGVQIAADIYRPDSEGKFPALLAMSEYTKELQGGDTASLCNEAGDIEYFVSRGYAHVIADSRGTGHSRGDVLLFGEREVQDGVELVEWLAKQPWCNGNVGMIGMSYFACVQLLVAKKNPPHLKCIFAYDPIYDLYRDCTYHGGKMSLFGILFPYFVASAQLIYLRGEKGAWKRVGWRSFLSMAWDFATQKHKFDDDWTRERSGCWAEGELDIPVYVGSGWEYAVGLHLRGVFDAYWHARGPRRMLVGPPYVPFRPYSSWRLESLRWYDRWLKGIDTGIDRDRPVNIWVMGANEWRSENEWPIERTRYVDLFLGPDGNRRKVGILSKESPGPDESKLSYLSWPLSSGNIGIPQLVYRSPVLRSEVEITGHIVLKLYASCTAKDTSFLVRLCDEREDGSFRVISRGWLKASHREIDEERSLPYRPFHPHQREEPLEPGQVYEFAIEVWPTSNLFLAGHRIRLELCCAESIYHDFPYTHLPSPHIGRVTIHSSARYPSSITLPLLDTEIVFENADSNLQFQDGPTGYFVMTGDERSYGSGGEFEVG